MTIRNWSTHGHWIGASSPSEADQATRPALVARCGGASMCQQCKRELRATIDGLAGDSSIPTPVGIIDEMTERAAHAMLAQQVGNVSRKPVEWQWENVLTGTDRELWRHNVRAVLEAALAGRAVVELPEVVADTVDGQEHFTADAVVRADGTPKVHFDASDDVCLSWHADVAEQVGLALVATARHARRLAAESSESPT